MNDSVAPIWRGPVSMAVRGMGIALPGDAVTTAEVLERIATQFGIDVRRKGIALARRLGISARHLSRPLIHRFEGTRAGATNAELCAQAIGRALEEAGAGVSDLQYLIGHTATPGQLVPPNAARVAALLGYRGPYLEVRQACTGFANALIVANGLLLSPQASLVAIVGSETGSVFLDPSRLREDQGQLVNLVQMGDGAAAVILEASRSAGSRITHVFYGASGARTISGFRLAGGGSDDPGNYLAQFHHNFSDVRRYGPMLFTRGAAAARDLGIELHDVDYIVPHQANGHMDKLVAQQFGIPPSAVFVNANRVGNTGSAAIWLALAELRSKLRSGNSVLTLGAEATDYLYGGFRYVH